MTPPMETLLMVFHADFYGDEMILDSKMIKYICILSVLAAAAVLVGVAAMALRKSGAGAASGPRAIPASSEQGSRESPPFASEPHSTNSVENLLPSLGSEFTGENMVVERIPLSAINEPITTNLPASKDRLEAMLKSGSLDSPVNQMYRLKGEFVETVHYTSNGYLRVVPDSRKRVPKTSRWFYLEKRLSPDSEPVFPDPRPE